MYLDGNGQIRNGRLDLQESAVSHQHCAADHQCLQADHWEQLLTRRSRNGGSAGPFIGVNLGFTRAGLTQILSAGRPRLDPSFERGADDPATIDRLHDPPPSAWLKAFRSD